MTSSPEIPRPQPTTGEVVRSLNFGDIEVCCEPINGDLKESSYLSSSSSSSPSSPGHTSLVSTKEAVPPADLAKEPKVPETKKSDNKSRRCVDPYAGAIEAFNSLDFESPPGTIIKVFVDVLQHISLAVNEFYAALRAQGADVDSDKVSLTSDDMVVIACYVISKSDPTKLLRLLPCCRFLSDYLFESASAARKKRGRKSGNSYFDTLYLGEGGFALATIQGAAQYFSQLEL